MFLIHNVISKDKYLFLDIIIWYYYTCIHTCLYTSRGLRWISMVLFLLWSDTMFAQFRGLCKLVPMEQVQPPRRLVFHLQSRSKWSATLQLLSSKSFCILLIFYFHLALDYLCKKSRKNWSITLNEPSQHRFCKPNLKKR